MHIYECIIIWAGPAGIWTALKLQELWVDCIILEAEQIGSSFLKWNTQTRFISPSFPGNAFGQVDLNSIHYDTSPGFMFKKEHMSGVEYAEYLNNLVKKFAVKVYENEKVLRVDKKQDVFLIQTSKQQYSCKYIISATWEFSFPAHGNITGAEYASHSSEIRNYSSFKSNDQAVPIIGWYESSIDAAYGLSKKGIASHLFSPHRVDDISSSDPSKVLSLYTLERFRALQKQGYISITQTFIDNITKQWESYILEWPEGSQYSFTQTPILATGFKSGLWYLWDLVSYRSDGNPKLASCDELDKTSNIFVVGPQVRQQETIFCFVYKFRLRFWVVALEIAHRLWKNIDLYSIQETWEKQRFYLDDLWSCGDECVC